MTYLPGISKAAGQSGDREAATNPSSRRYVQPSQAGTPLVTESRSHSVLAKERHAAYQFICLNSLSIGREAIQPSDLYQSQPSPIKGGLSIVHTKAPRSLNHLA